MSLVSFKRLSSLSPWKLLASYIRESSGITIFTASPPLTIPILEVVSLSILPNLILVIAWEATVRAFIPFSGAIPAWAGFPIIFISPFAEYGACIIATPGFPLESRINE